MSKKVKLLKEWIYWRVSVSFFFLVSNKLQSVFRIGCCRGTPILQFSLSGNLVHVSTVYDSSINTAAMPLTKVVVVINISRNFVSVVVSGDAYTIANVPHATFIKLLISSETLEAGKSIEVLLISGPE